MWSIDYHSQRWCPEAGRGDGVSKAITCASCEHTSPSRSLERTPDSGGYTRPGGGQQLRVQSGVHLEVQRRPASDRSDLKPGKLVNERGLRSNQYTSQLCQLRNPRHAYQMAPYRLLRPSVMPGHKYAAAYGTASLRLTNGAPS